MYDHGNSSGTGPLRGVVVGVTAATLAVAAHGLAGGGYPGSAALTLLLLTAAGVGAISSLLPVPAGKSGRAALLGALAAGQMSGHLAMTAAIPPDSMSMTHESFGGAGVFGHVAAMLGLSSGPMILAHGVATLVCAVLITAAERLYSVVSHTVRTLTAHPRPLAAPGPARWFNSPARSYRFLRAAGLGSRAPPVPA